MISELIQLLSSPSYVTYSLDMDVRCTEYKHHDDQNGDNVDVRILVMGLNAGSYDTTQVIPDHNSSMNITSKTDLDGIFWTLGKAAIGKKSLLFKVDVYEGNGTSRKLVASGDDDAS